MTFYQLLQFIQQRHIFLRFGSRGRVVFWAPNVRVPRPARSAIKEHTPTLAELLRDNDVNVCPSQQWHRQEWRYAGNGRYQCGVCARLQPYVMPEEKSMGQKKAG